MGSIKCHILNLFLHCSTVEEEEDEEEGTEQKNVKFLTVAWIAGKHSIFERNNKFE